MSIRRFPRRKALLVGLGGGFAALAVGSMAWACTVISGITWYDDGSASKSGPSGTMITAFATGARANQPFQLVAGTNTSPGHEDHACMDLPAPINPNVRTANSRGFIGNTSGPVNRPQGEWQICFRQLPDPPAATATSPVFFTVT